MDELDFVNDLPNFHCYNQNVKWLLLVLLRKFTFSKLFNIVKFQPLQY